MVECTADCGRVCKIQRLSGQDNANTVKTHTTCLKRVGDASMRQQVEKTQRTNTRTAICPAM